MPTTLIWVLTVLGFCAVMAMDFVLQARHATVPSTRNAGLWCAGYMIAAVIFGLSMMWWWNADKATEFFAGYLTELSLSVDNLFVFLIIMSRYKIPRENQQKVLLLGITIAIAARAVFIFLGATFINLFSWTFYFFGAYLLYTAVKLLFEKDETPQDGESETRMHRILAKILPTSSSFRNGNLFTREGGVLAVTPLFTALLTLGFTDVLFALDSIPAIYGLTDEAYIVLAANACALLGLRQMFFLLEGLLERMVYLSHGLAAILAFIGIKLILHAAHKEGIDVPEIPTLLSCAVIASVLAVAIVASIVKTRVKTS